MIVIGHAGARRAADGRAQGDRQAPGRHPRPRQHGRAVHGQDRHADRGADRAGSGTSTPTGERQRARARARLAQQPLRDRPEQPAGRGDPRARARCDVAGWTQDRRGAVRLRAPPRLGAGGAAGAAPAGRQGRARGRAAALEPLRGRRRGDADAARRGGARGADGALRGAWARRASACSASPGATAAEPRQPSRWATRRELVFAGFAAFLDPPKAERRARRSQRCRRSGVARQDPHRRQRAGDAARLRRAGPAGRRRAHRRRARRALSDDALRARVETTNLFCRVTPAQKNRVILALQAPRPRRRLSWATASTTRPSLHAADVGISVDGAADVAKEAADLILLEHDLAVLARRRAARAGAPSATS